MTDFDRKIIQKMSSLFEGFGVNPILGRILGILLIHEEPQSLIAIAQALDLSKAAISIQIRLLEDLGYCEKLPKKKDRQHYYQLRPDYLESSYRRRLDKEEYYLKELEGLLKERSNQERVSEKRLKEFVTFSRLMMERSLDALAHLKTKK